jgi:hypothetical protein
MFQRKLYLTHVVGVTTSIACVMKPTHTQPQSAGRGRLRATHTGALVVCGHGAYMPKLETGAGGAHWWVNTHIHGARQLI